MHRPLVLTTLALLATSPATAQPQQDELSPASIKNITAQFRKHGLEAPPAKPDGVLRLTTYNIHELYDDADDPALSGRDEDAGRTMIPTRRQASAAALAAIDADIIALQEVESLAALEWYRSTMLPEMGYDHAASEDVGHAIGLEQAVLSRYPIITTQTWTDRVIGEHPPLYRGRPNRLSGQPMTFRRSPLMAEIALVDGESDAATAETGTDLPEADRLTLLIVHAKTGDGSEAWRAAEGKAIAEIVGELRADRPDRRVIVLGDFAVPPSESETHLAPIEQAGFTDAVQHAADAAGTPLDANVTATSISGDRACRVFLGQGVSLAEGTSPFTLGTVVPPERIDRRMGFRMPGFASDHYPLTVDLAR